jgi:CheY-like chemotaxis protein
MGRISLVVDDEPAVRKYISAILQREHFQTVEAGDGEHGLRIVQELGEEVALIVSDIHMPNGDGVAFAQAVRAAPLGQDGSAPGQGYDASYLVCTGILLSMLLVLRTAL